MNNYHPTTKIVKSITGTKKREFNLATCEAGTERNTASYWDGGNRNYYSILNIKTGQTKNCPTGVFPNFDAKIKLENDEILIQTSSGKSSFARITCLENDYENVKAFLQV